jgi:hypothetical protein
MVDYSHALKVLVGEIAKTTQSVFAKDNLPVPTVKDMLTFQQVSNPFVLTANQGNYLNFSPDTEDYGNYPMYNTER